MHCLEPVAISIQEADDSHSRLRCSGYCPVDQLLGYQCNWTVNQFWYRSCQKSSIATCSFLYKVAKKQRIQSCYFMVCDDWMWCGISVSWAWQRNCMESMEGFSRSDTDTFTKLWRSGEISTEDFEMIEHFDVLVYERTCPHKSADKCRKYLFTQMNCTMDNCPPARDALLEHFPLGMSQPDIWTRWSKQRTEKMLL